MNQCVISPIIQLSNRLSIQLVPHKIIVHDWNREIHTIKWQGHNIGFGLDIFQPINNKIETEAKDKHPTALLSKFTCVAAIRPAKHKKKWKIVIGF